MSAFLPVPGVYSLNTIIYGRICLLIGPILPIFRSGLIGLSGFQLTSCQLTIGARGPGSLSASHRHGHSRPDRGRLVRPASSLERPLPGHGHAVVLLGVVADAYAAEPKAS